MRSYSVRTRRSDLPRGRGLFFFAAGSFVPSFFFAADYEIMPCKEKATLEAVLNSHSGARFNPEPRQLVEREKRRQNCENLLVTHLPIILRKPLIVIFK